MQPHRADSAALVKSLDLILGHPSVEDMAMTRLLLLAARITLGRETKSLRSGEIEMLTEALNLAIIEPGPQLAPEYDEPAKPLERGHLRLVASR